MGDESSNSIEFDTVCSSTTDFDYAAILVKAKGILYASLWLRNASSPDFDSEELSLLPSLRSNNLNCDFALTSSLNLAGFSFISFFTATETHRCSLISFTISMSSSYSFSPCSNYMYFLSLCKQMQRVLIKLFLHPFVKLSKISIFNGLIFV